MTAQDQFNFVIAALTIVFVLLMIGSLIQIVKSIKQTQKPKLPHIAFCAFGAAWLVNLFII